MIAKLINFVFSKIAIIYELIQRLHAIVNGYAYGMVKYRKANEPNLSRIQALLNILPALIDESKEFLYALRKFQIKESFFELNDIYHTIVLSIVYTILPKVLLNNVYTFYFVFFMSGVLTPAKHGIRYLKYGCIRSIEHCKHNDHNCVNNNLTKKKRKFKN